ncbi:MAG: efflux RND transporter periplasmic adaptor subunit [Hydrotalea flava]|uniref:efflux RND transporter periplasmic adaptor subunit n=1 Tax=Hydrotalea TaxID=1004300 RepID=UPI000944FFBA|nr:MULTISPECIES: efflux RND transporter periplasmic adaptor subunit [Hydrotalea]MBY0349004.1 efflux RND transporter periplasmic adaptor subunit [Hydrotalea flava]RWZ86511.1 MAG: efflux RND transporter periplasmic adaptor subunit [Hydrotalea sp. AMD]
MNKKLFWTIIILVILLGGLWGLKAAGIIGKDEGIKVSAEKAENRTIIESVNASGKIYPEVEVKISPDISGEVVALNVNEGDTVKKGQELAKIYADIYVTQRDQVAAVVAQAQAQVANSQANLAGLKATVEQTEANFNRQKKLLDDKVISRQEFETAQQAYRAAEANYNAALQNIIANKANIKNAQAQLAKANEDLSRTIITAPMSGVISLMSIKKGERVAGNSFNVGTEMMRIADLSSIVAQVDVGENDIPKIKIGDTALVEVDAYNDRKFKGVVYKIANPVTNASSTTTSTDVTNYKVHIRLLQDSYKDLIVKGRFPFRPGMSASADIQTKTASNVLSVPLNAVTTRDMNADSTSNKKTATSNNNSDATVNNNTPNDNTREVVFVIQKDGTVKMVPVKTGIQDLNYIQITNGLKLGDEVVTGPYATVSKLLKDKDKVLVTPKDKLYEVKAN